MTGSKHSRRSPARSPRRLKLRARLSPALVTQGREAVAAWFYRWLEAWQASADPYAAQGDTWAKLLSGRWFAWPPVPPAEAQRLERFLRYHGGLEVERAG